MSTVLGYEAKLNYKSGGIAAGGSWTAITNAKDVTVNGEKGEADVTTRANNGYRARKGALKDLTIDFEMVWDTSDAAFNAMRDSFYNGTLIGIQALDVLNGQGPQMDMEVFGFNKKEPLEEAQSVSITLKVARSATAPSWVSASA